MAKKKRLSKKLKDKYAYLLNNKKLNDLCLMRDPLDGTNPSSDEDLRIKHADVLNSQGVKDLMDFKHKHERGSKTKNKKNIADELQKTAEDAIIILNELPLKNQI